MAENPGGYWTVISFIFQSKTLATSDIYYYYTDNGRILSTLTFRVVTRVHGFLLNTLMYSIFSYALCKPTLCGVEKRKT
jgi:tricorn protease-like protein